MRLAIVSDIHGNYEALQRVLEDIERESVDRTISLGDNVGYGPDPELVVQTLHHLRVPSVLGNHELGIIDPAFLSWFNPSARQSLDITRSLLSQEGLEIISGFGLSQSIANGYFVHGFPPDSVSRYLFEVSDEELKALLGTVNWNVCFVGHTHELSLVEYDGADVRQRPLTCGEYFLEPKSRCIVNAGSVGQPRDGDRRAKYLLWDDERGAVEIRCLKYDVAKTVKKIMDLGFPQSNARRLL